jgi:arylsulfatase A-like enzyme
MQRRQFLELAAATPLPAAAASQAASAGGQRQKRPNILLILTDQQSHTAWSGARNPWLATPAMDSLADAGTVFEEAYCSYPVCSPSRASIFTSRLPHETGVMENGKAITAGLPTMGEIFRAAGYRTAYGGKWHLPKAFDGMTGFDKIAGGHALGAKMDTPLADACVEWLRTSGKGETPFLLVASFMNPHDICDWIRQHPGAREHAGRFRYPPAPGNQCVDPEEPTAIQYHRTAGYDLMSKAVGIASEWMRDDFRQYLHDYYRMVEAVDKEIGRVVKALKDARLDGDTLIAFASDHGEGMGAHRWVQKAGFWEETAHVPLMFSGAGVKRGVRSRSLVTLMDILPTFCDYAGIEAPPDFRGRSLRPDLEGGTVPAREFVTSHLRFETAEREGRMLRTERYKYIVHNTGSRAELLFDLLTDPGESRNLAVEAGSREVLLRHRELLGAELKRTGDSFVPVFG